MTHSIARKLVFDGHLVSSKDAVRKLVETAILNLQDELEQELYVQGLQRKGDMESMNVAVPSSNMLQMDYWVAVRCDVEPRE